MNASAPFTAGRIGLLALLALFPPAQRLPAQATLTTVSNRISRYTPGQLLERVVSEANPRQQYAVYLPSSYRPDKTWPILLLMDPRGRAMIPLSRAQAVAERLGYIALSSYNTRSDEGTDPNADAINAMLADAQRHFSIDIHRLYLVGQSGTARASWIYGYNLRGNVAGIIGIGASKPESFLVSPLARGAQPPLVFYGAAGTTDYNYDEMWALDTTLTRANFPHRISYFDGPHAWPPEATLTDAVTYMELMAMRYGLKPRDKDWIDSSYAAGISQAAAMADSGDAYHAWRKYLALANDFDGMRDVREAAGKATQYARNDAVKRTDRHIAETVKAQSGYNQRLAVFLGDLRKSAPAALEKSLARAEVRDLEARVAGSDSIDANAAERGLEQLWVYASFYEPMDYLDRGDPTRALAILDVAQAMRPNHPDVCYNQARAFARLKRESQAIEALECAARSYLSAERIENDPDLKTLGGQPAFRALVTRLHKYPTGSPDRYGQ